jgi:hypothetical protein
MCTFFVYGSENDRILQSRYKTAVEELKSMVNDLGLSFPEAANMVAENYQGVTSGELLNRYNAVRSQAPAAVAAPRATLLPAPSQELLNPKDYPQFNPHYGKVINILAVVDNIKSKVESGADLDIAMNKISFQAISPLNNAELKNLYLDLASHAYGERIKIAHSHMVHSLLNQERNRNGSEGLVATAPPFLDYAWENNPLLRVVPGAPEQTINIEGQGRFNIYNVTSFGHCGLYAINTTREEVLAKARQANNRSAGVNQLAQNPGEPLSIFELSEIGQLLEKNIVFLTPFGKVTQEWDESTEEMKDLPAINVAWETYYVFNTGEVHFQIAAPVGNELLNKYGRWKQSVVKTDRDFPDGNIDYVALDRSQTLAE